MWLMVAARLTIILPAKDPGALFEQHLCALLDRAETRSQTQIIVVDDGSTDSTVQDVAVNYPVRLLVFPQNRGKGAALRSGFQAALSAGFTDGDLIGFIDSDGDIDARWVFELAGLLDADPSLAAAIGAKDLDRYDASLLRKIASSSFSLIVSWLMPTGVRDTQVGVKVFTAKFLADVLPKTSATGFLLDVEILAAAHRRGARIATLPVEISLARASSTISRRSIWRMFTGVLSLSLRSRRGTSLATNR